MGPQQHTKKGDEGSSSPTWYGEVLIPPKSHFNIFFFPYVDLIKLKKNIWEMRSKIFPPVDSEEEKKWNDAITIFLRVEV